MDIVIFKGLGNKVASELRKAKTTCFMLTIAQSGGNSSSLWRHIRLTKRRSNQRKGIIQLNVNGVIISDSMTIANALNANFIQSVEELAANFKPIELSDTSVNDAANSLSIAQTDQGKIQQIMNPLNNSKAKDIFGLLILLKSILIL